MYLILRNSILNRFLISHFDTICRVIRSICQHENHSQEEENSCAVLTQSRHYGTIAICDVIKENGISYLLEHGNGVGFYTVFAEKCIS